ncbi:MAG: hypothetical protein H7A45_13655 [Verrucomicrobiales bacterium]|nr:hypothetical protein [Verrucomicrobiales bacterium]
MDIAKLQAKLLAAARHEPADDRVPYAFEQRIMARIRRRGSLDRWGVWARWMWQAAVPCLGLTVVLCALAFSTRPQSASRPPLSEQFETAFYAALDTSEGSW